MVLKELYMIDNDPERRKFLDELFNFMKQFGKPILRIPFLDNNILDLFKLYKSVCSKGGLLQVTATNLWSNVAIELGIQNKPNLVQVLHNNYFKYLYSFETVKQNFSKVIELKAISSNKENSISNNTGSSAKAKTTEQKKSSPTPASGPPVLRVRNDLYGTQKSPKRRLESDAAINAYPKRFMTRNVNNYNNVQFLSQQQNIQAPFFMSRSSTPISPAVSQGNFHQTSSFPNNFTQNSGINLTGGFNFNLSRDNYGIVHIGLNLNGIQYSGMLRAVM